MQRLLYLLLFLPLFAACSGDGVALTGQGELVISDIRCSQGVKAVVKTRSVVDSELAIEILDADGHVYRGMQYAPGAILPNRFSLIAGNYTLSAYSVNTATWMTDNDGRGSAVYEGRQPFSVEPDWVTYISMQVPMINYGVAYSLPANFTTWFPTYEFTVTSGTRSCALTTEQIAYYDPATNPSFTFNLHLVNIDGEVYDIQQTYESPRTGLIYNVVYGFASDDDPTKINIGISYDDTFEEIAHEITLY